MSPRKPASKKKREKDKQDASPMLPVPEVLLRFHLDTLEPLMKNWETSEHIPPVLLITAPKGVGKRQMVHYLAQWILCQPEDSSSEAMNLFADEAAAPTVETSSSQKKRPCGECSSCKRAIENHWIDFKEIISETTDGKENKLKVEDFDDLKASLGYTAFDGTYRVTLIHEVDKITEAAANSLLKVLEEPPANWVFFLTASDETLVLPTILSRCQRLRLRPLSTPAVQDLLLQEGVPLARAQIAARLSAGSIERARSLASDSNWEQREVFLRFLAQPHLEVSQLIDWSARDPQNLHVMLDQLESLSADLLLWSVAEEHRWINQDGAQTLERHADFVTRILGGREAARGFWLARSERLAEVRRKSLAPLNRKLLVQEALMPWLELSR